MTWVDGVQVAARTVPSDEELCALVNIVYNDTVYRQLGVACASGMECTLREVFAAAGETYYDKLEHAASMDREDWYDFVRAVNDTGGVLGGMRVIDVGGMGLKGVCLVDTQGTPYVILRGKDANDHGADTDWLGVSDEITSQQAQAKAYAEYLFRLTGHKVVVAGHAEGGGAALFAAVTSDAVSRCVSFDARGLSADFVESYGTQIVSAAERTTNYYTYGDVASPWVASVAGATVVVKPTRTDAGWVKAHACASLLTGALSFGERMGEVPDSLTMGGLLSWLESAGESTSLVSGASVEVAMRFERFVAWLGKNASASDRKRLNPFINQLIDAAHGVGRSSISSLISREPNLMGLLMAYAPQCPDLRGLFAEVAGGVMLASVATGGDSTAILERILSAAHVSSRARTRVMSSFKRYYRKLWDEGVDTTIAARSVGTAVHDFGDAQRDELLGIVAEIEQEPFYDVTRWDVWYRLQRFCGRLTLESYRNDIRTYQRKVLDMAGTTSVEVRERFARARELDANFEQQMQTVLSSLRTVCSKIRALGYGI